MNYEQLNNNVATLSGEVISKPKFSHEMYGEGFYEFNLKVRRLSDTYDIIPVTVSDRILMEHNIEVGKKIKAVGQFRSFNKIEDGKSRLMLNMFVREMLPYSAEENPNKISITGCICKTPIYRITPFNREIADVIIATNRNYNKSDYIPCIVWGRNARFMKNLAVGDKVQLEGRIQSREYQKKDELSGEVTNHTAYEVSIAIINLLSRNKVKEDDEFVL